MITFTADGRHAHDAGALVVDVPGCLESEREMFAFYYGAMRFPDYFGWNWDAFDECIGDLSWLDTESIVISHRDLPFRDDRQNCFYYLDSLTTAIVHVSFARKKMIVSFPDEFEDVITSLVLSDYKKDFPQLKTLEDVDAFWSITYRFGDPEAFDREFARYLKERKCPR